MPAADRAAINEYLLAARPTAANTQQHVAAGQNRWMSDAQRLHIPYMHTAQCQL